MAHEYYFAVNTDDDKGVPFGPVNKDNMDVSRLIVDLTCWLDPNETITQVAHMMIGVGICPNIGFGAWQSDFPVNCGNTAPSPPADTYPLVFARTSVFSSGKMVEMDVSGGTPGLTYAVSFTVTAGVSFRRRVIDICVAIDQPINSAMVGLGDMYPSFDFPLVINASTILPYGFTGIVLVEVETWEGPVTITLPPSPVMGQEIRIKDVFGTAAGFNIVVNTVDGSLIDDTATYTIAFGFGNLGIVWTGVAMEHLVMRRILLLLGLLALTAGPAAAQFPGNIPPNTVMGNIQPTARPPVPVSLGGGQSISALDYGVKADGVTSDDVAMKAATDACGELPSPGRTLVLPAGQILLTGAAQITLANCNLVGAGVPPGWRRLAGTTFLLTSTTVPPFILGNSLGLSGINFYWPNQTTGTTVYPALFTDTSLGVSELRWDNVNIMNAYDGFNPSVVSGGQGQWVITNSNMYAMHDMFRIGSAGDYIFINNVAFNQGSWQSVDGDKPWFNSTVELVAKTNTVFHIIAPTTSNWATFKVSNTSLFAWGYGIKVDAAPAAISFGDFNWSVDGVGTVVDTTAGGALYNFQMQCANCTSTYVNPSTGATTKSTAFKLGANGRLTLSNSVFNSASGTFIETSGTQVFLNNNQLAFGAVNDGTDFYLVNVLFGSPHIDMRGNFIAGMTGSTKHHVLKSANVLSGFVVSNNSFIYVNDFLNLPLGGGQNMFNGNVSEATVSAVPIITTGTGTLIYTGNNLDKAPAPVVSACGAGAALGGGSVISHGFVHIGTTVPTTSCQLTAPFITGSTSSCVFGSSFIGTGNIAAAPGGTPGTPAIWTITSENDMANLNIFYHCGVDR